MLRLQQKDVLPALADPTIGYQPPWRDKFFFLINGLDQRVIVVDENYDEFPIDDKLKFEAAVASLADAIEVFKDVNIFENNPRKMRLYPTSNSLINPFPDRKCRDDKIDPRKISYSKWDSKAVKMDKNPFESDACKEFEEMLYPNGRNDEMEDEDSSDDENDDGKEKDEKKKKEKWNFGLLFHLPLEVFEIIIRQLDGLSYLRLCHAFGKWKIVVTFEVAFNYNWRRLEGVWRKSCLEEMLRQRFHELVTSYENIIYQTSRIFHVPTDDDDNPPFFNLFPLFNYQDVCTAEFLLKDKFTQGKVSVKNMLALEKKIKVSFDMYKHTLVPKYGENLKFDSPRVLLGASGSLTWYTMFWRDKKRLMINENLDLCEQRRFTQICYVDVRFSKIMYYPAYADPKNKDKFKSNTTLPTVDRILLTSCKTCTCLRSLNGEVRGTTITHARDEHIKEYYHKMDPVIAVLGNILVIWASPRHVRFYRVEQVDGRYRDNLFQELLLHDGLNFWTLNCNYTEYFIPVLRRIANPGGWEDNNIRQTFGANALKDNYFELQMINMRFGTDTIGIKNSYSMKMEDGVENPHFFVHHQSPQYYYRNALETRSMIDHVYAGAEGYGAFVFWNNRAMAYSGYDGITWHFHSWKKALKSLEEEVPSLDDGENLKVTQVNLCAKNLLGAMINGNLIIFECKIYPGLQYKSIYKAEPQFVMKPLRIIATDFMSMKGIEPVSMSFSFELGDPYFFIVLRNVETNSAYDFWIKRICFRIPEEYEQDQMDTIPDEVLEASTKSFLEEEEERWLESEKVSPVSIDNPQYPISTLFQNLSRRDTGLYTSLRGTRIGAKDIAVGALAVDHKLFTPSSYAPFKNLPVREISNPK